MSYQVTWKKSTRLAIAIVISIAMVFTGFALMPMSSSYAAENDSLLTVTLTGAKASTYPVYYDEGDDDVYVPSTDGSGNGTWKYPTGMTKDDTDMGEPRPYQDSAYDYAELLVYSPNAERWIKVAEDSLFDEDACEAAYDKFEADYVSASPAKKPDEVYAARNVLYGTTFSKPAFEFRFDSKYNGMKATVKYSNMAGTKEAYGQIADQIIGGYFGDIDDYVDNNVTTIQTFALAAGSKTFALKKAVFETLKVTPVSGPMEKDNTAVDTDAETWQDTAGYAALITKDRGGTIERLNVPSLNLSDKRWDKTAKVWKQTNLLSDPTTGTYVFPALQGQKLLFYAAGEYQDGSKNADGTLKSWGKSYQGQWLGGYQHSYYNDIVGNPKTLKKVAVGTANKAVGTIKLAKGTATIKGTLPNSDGGVYAFGVAKDQYVSENSRQETVPATFAEYAAANDQKKTSKKAVSATRVYVASNKDEYIANGRRNSYETFDQGVFAWDFIAISKAEYNALPSAVQYTDTDPVTGVETYYKRNWIEVSAADYSALPTVLQAGTSEGKYYKRNVTQIDVTAYNNLPGALRYADGSNYYERNVAAFYKDNVAAATEAEYFASLSGAYPDEVSIAENESYLYTLTDAAGYAADPILQEGTWTSPTGTTSYYKGNYTKVSPAEYAALIWPASDSKSNPTMINDGVDFYKANWVKEIDKATYDALPNRAPKRRLTIPATTTAPTSYKYFKYEYSYQKTVAPYVYWKYSPTYRIENLPAGVYAVTWGGQTKVITVKSGKTYTYNLKAEKNSVNAPTVRTNVTGTKKKGQKLTAATYIDTAGFGAGQPSYTYYWTDGSKIISKKAALKLSKTTFNKNLWVISVAKIGSYQYPSSDGWQAAPGNKWGVVGFDVTVTGTFKSGKKVKANITNAQVAGVKYSYQWLRNGKAIKGATKASYKLTKADKGKKISVKVIGKRDGFTAKTVKSKATKSK